MKNIYTIIAANIPLVIILYSWLTGTTSTEYWNQFKTIEGDVIGPYTIVKVDHELIFNDTSTLSSEGYDVLIDVLREYKMEERLYSVTKPKMMSLDEFKVDSVPHPMSKEQWLQLKEEHEKIVFQKDTVFKNTFGAVPVRIAIMQKIYGYPYFSISGHPDQLKISEYTEATYEEDETGLKFRIEYRFSPNKKISSWDRIREYNEHISDVLPKKDGKIVVTRLDDDEKVARAYMIKESDGEEIFYDEFGFEALSIEDDRFVLWYDNLFIKLLIVIQLLTYFSFAVTYRDHVKAKANKPAQKTN